VRTTLSLAVGATILSACVVLCIIALYAAGALAAAQAVRPVPFVGPLASERIENWVLGAEEPDVIDDVPPLGTGEPLTESGHYTGTLDGWGPADCAVPRGLPVAGPIRSGFRPAGRPDHTGVDIAVGTGTPVHATQCGIVTFAGWSSIGYGYLVVVQHDTYATYYGHNGELMVQAGDRVGLGQVVASSGSTGHSTGPHVHYETRIDGGAVDPLVTFP
jgi:murein DD-endopeptidase MepM/ murein hydrolase activator NlpD